MFNVRYILTPCLHIASGYLETGALVFVLAQYGIAESLLTVLCYQIGNLVPYPVRLNRSVAMIAATISLVLALLYFQSGTLPLLLLSVALLSAALQTVRTELKEIHRESKEKKRYYRLGGFALGIILYSVFYWVVPIITALILLEIALFKTESRIHLACGNIMQTIYGVMILHQMHYFVYCYAVIIVSYQIFGVWGACAVFVPGWFTYTYGRRFWKGQNYRKIFLLGHSALFLILTGMFFVEPDWLKGVLWILTGFFGTTEFCIGKLEKEFGSEDTAAHNTAENLGHILGVLACITIYTATNNLMLTPLFASGFVLLAIGLMVTVPHK